jgi:hypothetical protein
MILKSKNSKPSIVNIFADFILSKIPHEEETILQVADCNNFLLVKGKTSYNVPLNLSEIKDEFTTKFESIFPELKLTHTIDLIEYDCDIEPKKSITHTYFNSENCSYHYKQIESYLSDDSFSYDYSLNIKKISDDDSLIHVSEFPHGHSLGQGRLFYYYGKHITYSIPPHALYTSVTLTISKEPETEFLVYNNFSGEYDNYLKSVILDVFDFDMSWLETEIKKVDWFSEITNPLEEYDFVKKINKDFIII